MPFLNEILAPPELGKMVGKRPVTVASSQTPLGEILGTGKQAAFHRGTW